MNVAGAGHAEAALQNRAEIGDDVAQHVLGDDHLKMLRIFDHLHDQRIDKEMIFFDVGILLTDGGKHALPQIVAVTQHVRFVRHRHARAAMRFRVHKRGADDALDAFAGVIRFLRRHFIRRAFLQNTAGIHIRAFSVFAKNNEVDVFHGFLFERT
ncbi:MAG: hypothetical protein ALAOOOJD_03556 [bacterium]|nr:hypothetical protein [bacterium]